MTFGRGCRVHFPEDPYYIFTDLAPATTRLRRGK
jgi:hypothetical protein